MPQIYARVVATADPFAQCWVGAVGHVVAVQHASGYEILLLLEFSTGQREVFRASEVEVCVCACGCGLPVSLATRTHARRGLIKGTPRRYLRGHNGRRGAFPGFPAQEPNPTGLCQCGCRHQTGRVRQTNFGAGYRRGWYARFCVGHDLSHRPRQTHCHLRHALTDDNVYVHMRDGLTRRG